MPGPETPLIQDLWRALALSAVVGLSGAALMPLLVDQLPGGPYELPLPALYFAPLVALQATALYGLLGWLGFRVARRRGLNPGPMLSPGAAVVSLGAGAAGGAVLVGAVSLIRALAPETLPGTLHPPTPLTALLASIAAAFGEEILCRLLLLSVLAWLLPRNRTGLALAITLAALLFGALHAPAWVALHSDLSAAAGGQVALDFTVVPLLSWVWLLLLNGVIGGVCGVVYVRWGVGAAVLSHLGADLVWHVLSVLLGAVG